MQANWWKPVKRYISLQANTTHVRLRMALTYDRDKDHQIGCPDRSAPSFTFMQST